MNEETLDKKMSQMETKTLAQALAANASLAGFAGQENFCILLSELAGLANSKIKVSDADAVPGNLFDKLSFGSGLSAEIVNRPGSPQENNDLIIRITRDDDGEILLTTAVPFDEVLADTEVNASNVPAGQMLDVRFAPIKLPSGSIGSIAFSPIAGSSYSDNRANVAIFGNDAKTLNGATKLLSCVNQELGENAIIVFDNPVEIVRKKFYWVFVAIHGQGRFLGKSVSSVVPASGDTAVSGVINNFIQDGAENWPDSVAGTTHNNGSIPYIQFNIVR